MREEIEKIKKYIKDYFEKNNLDGIVLGISGGLDSAVVAYIFAEALGKENVYAVWLPIRSNDDDYKDALLVTNSLGIELNTFDLNGIYDAFIKEREDKLNLFDDDILKEANINLRSRLRINSLYFIARSLSDTSDKNYIVAGTSNLSELYIGYFTKGGDDVSDIKILVNFTKREVVEMAKELNIPNIIVGKRPSDGMSDMSDEEKTGVLYSILDSYLLGEEIDKKNKSLIENLHSKNQHKFNPPVYIKK